MAALFLPLFFLFMELNEIHNSVVIMQKQIRGLAELDQKLGNKAEEVSHAINAALAINIELGVLYAMCPAATVSGTVAALQTKGEIARAMQELYLHTANAQVKVMSYGFSTEFNSPQRRGPGLCQLPGILYCPQKTLFSIRNLDGTKPAGVKGESSNCVQSNWSYSDPRVRPL